MTDTYWMAARRLARTLDDGQVSLLLALARLGDKAALLDEIVGEARLRKPMVSSTGEEEVVLIAAVDYALGRQTTVSQTMVEEVLARADALSDDARGAILGKVSSAITRGEAGAKMDVELWKSVEGALIGPYAEAGD